MSEQLLKAIIQLFAIVAKERVTEDERNNIKDFLSIHLNQEAIPFYINMFDSYLASQQVAVAPGIDNVEVDEDTKEFVDDWANIIDITKEVNKALTMQQKVFITIKIIELIYVDHEISERQGNLIFYIGEALKLSRKTMTMLRDFVIAEDMEELDSKNILIIDEGSGEYKTKGPRMVTRNLTGLIAILRLPELQLYFIKYLGISILYLNGIPLKSRKIEILPAGSTIRGNKIKAIYYSDVVSNFMKDEQKTTITFTAERIFYHFKSGKVGLQNVTLSEAGGKLVGIMGGSGAGKSTLLNVLNGIETPSSGRVLVNGIDIHEESEKVQGVIGYVPQDDLLIEELTVFENLFFAAKLCLAHLKKDELTKRVVKLLNQLGLTEAMHLKVGSPLDQIISGGQRKRLNIGLELIREPSLLFVDEPTSGLSSRDSENIMDLLKELSLRGKMVFVVIHQPSSDIFKLFDSLCILDSGGYQIFYGNPVEAVVYFKEIINAANKNQSVCPECGNINPEQIFNIIETRVVNEYGRLTNVRKISPEQWYHYFRQAIKLPKVNHVKAALQSSQLIPNWFNQLKVFLKRDVLAKVANKQYLLINLLEAPLLALFMAYLVKYYSVIDNPEGDYSFFANDNIPIYFFMSIVVALFMGLTVSAEEIFKDRKILKRERYLNLSKSSYLVSKILVLFTISAIQTGSFVLIGNWILEIEGMGLRLWLILFSCSAFANLLGLNISASFNSAVTIYILIPILLIPQLVLSGVVISFDKFNPEVSATDGVPVFGDMMASRWGFEAAMVTQFKDNPFEKLFYDLNSRIADAEYKNVYYIPRLESEASYVFNNRRKRSGPEGEKLEESMSLLRNEINKELELIGEDKFKMRDRLTIQRYDSATHRATQDFLETLRNMYSNRFKSLLEEKDSVAIALLTEEISQDELDNLRLRYQNEAISNALKNLNTPYRVVKIEDELVQKIYPIYNEKEHPDHIFDFRSQFFAPTKYFGGFYIDTLWFNVVFIWFMTAALFIMLYYDVLKRVISFFEYQKRRRK
ncbi:MAG: ATP-binding cassette domain-containing protein [Candidatus Cyclobacteriaceae bacterium M2_1C_046]